jgi:hypothetical protein
MHEKQAITQFHAALRDVGCSADKSKFELKPEFKQQRPDAHVKPDVEPKLG